MTQIWMEERCSWVEQKITKSEWRLTPIVPVVFYTGIGTWKSPFSLTALMDLPEGLKRFIPTFDTLFLDVKATDPDELTQTGHALGWLLTVLRQENADAPAMRQALLDALAGLRDLHTQDREAYTRAILYLFLLILHRRKAGEHQDLLRILTQEDTQNQEIVDMADSIIELSERRGIEQGSRRTSIESTIAILNTRFSDTDADTLTTALEAIEDLNRLKKLNLEASLVESFPRLSRTLRGLRRYQIPREYEAVKVGMFIDSHAHIFSSPQFNRDRDAVLKRAHEAEVSSILVIGFDMETSLGAVELAEKHSHIYATVGMHPHDAKDLTPNVLKNFS